MKQLKIFLFFIILAFFFTSCDILNKDDDSETKPETLYVQFNNDAESVAAITSIVIQAMGNAGEANSTPQGDWSSDILKSGEKIAPGSHVYFTLEIPNLHWVRYRVAIDDGKGGELWLHEQAGWEEDNTPITHWGSDERTCHIEIRENNGRYSIGGWGDWAGIDD